MQDSYDRLQAALAGRYTLLREIGRGGMAVVYLADDPRYDRRVALKAIRPEVLHALGTERFEREITIAAHLAHPHILPLFDSGTAGDTLFFVMPYVEGESLRDRLRRERQLPISDVVQIGRDVASALAYAHGQGVVHRDIKPENILLEGGEALVADFGLARAIAGGDTTAITDSGIVVGTPAYMSPEQSQQSGIVDGRSDVYTLGCVLFEMVAGEPPFTGATAHAILARHLHEAPTPLHVLRPGTPAWLDGLVTRMLAKVPADRPAGAAEVLRILTESASGVGPALDAVASGRRRRMAGLAGGAVLLGFVGWWLFGPDGAPADPHRVVVFPARVTGIPGTATGYGDGFAASLIASLNGTEVIRAVEMRGDVTARARNAELAGAGSWVESSLIAGDSLRLSLVLHRRVGGDDRPHALAFAVGTDAWEVGLAAAKVLLADLLDVSPAEALVPVLQNRSPLALAHFFQGEESYHRAAFAQALTHFEAAVRADSGFSYAALRGAQAANWLGDPARGGALVALAARHPGDLPPRHATFARGLTAYLEGRADSAVSSFRNVLQVDPSDFEAWTALGETFTHLLPRDGSLDSLAEDAFRRARGLDTAFAPALPHLIEAAVRRGDAAGAAALLREFAAGNPDSIELDFLNLAVQCVQAGPRKVNWEGEMAARPRSVLSAAQILTSGGLRQPECARAAWAALQTGASDANLRFSALVVLQGVYAVQGDPAAALRVVRSDTLFNVGNQDHLLTLDALAGVVPDSLADQFADGVLNDLANRPGEVGTPQLSSAALWLVRQGRTADAERIRAVATIRGGRTDRLVAESIRTHLLLARGDTTAAVAAFEQLRPDAPKESLAWSPWETLVADQMTLAALYLALGRPRDAIRAASVVDAPAVLTDIIFLPASLRIRAAGADALGDQQLARESRRRLTELGQTALP